MPGGETFAPGGPVGDIPAEEPSQGTSLHVTNTMGAPVETLSREQIQKEIAAIQKRALWVMLVSFAGLLYFTAISPFIPSGPLLVPALGFSLSDLPSIPWIGGLVYLSYGTIKSGKRQNALRAQLTKLAIEDTARASGTTPVGSPGVSGPSDRPPISAVSQPPPSEEIAWFPNRTRDRQRLMAKIGGAALVIGVVLIVVLAVVAHAAFYGAWGSMIFAVLFTALLFGLMMVGVGLSSLRTEPLRVGSSPKGAHRELPPGVKDTGLQFIPWSFVASAQNFGSESMHGVALKTLDGKLTYLQTSAEGEEALLASFERWKTPGAYPPRSVGSPAPPLGAPVPGGAQEHALPELPVTSWHPNGLRRMFMATGVGLLLIGLALTPILGPYALHPRTAQAGMFLAMPYMIALVMIWGARSYPNAVAVGPEGFLVRTGKKISGLRFSEAVGISAPGFPLECTLRSGRTVRFQSLGPREKRDIQEAYRTFKELPLGAAHAHPSAPTAVTWIANPARWSAAARFIVPLAIPVVVAAIVVPLFLSAPTTYFGYVVALPLAMLPSPLALFTIRAYRRAPSAVGISESELVVRYPHHLYPAVALERVRWTDLEQVAGPGGRAFKGTLGEPGYEMLSEERYLTFRTKSGVTYTLGPVSPEIELAVVRRCPPELTQKDINVAEM